VVVATYSDMKDCATALYDAVNVYVDAPSQENLSLVCDKWRAMRIPWEQSEGFLFGPAAVLNLDPSLDSWPLDKGGIDKILSEESDITLVRIASSTLHGFHAIEYLIFSEGQPKTSLLSGRETEYLLAATELLRNDTYQLWANWVGEDAAQSDERVIAALDEAELGVAFNYSEQFNRAGSPGSTFTTQSDAIDQIIDGCMDIASEVGAQKIGGPYGVAKVNYDQAVLEVESWYSWNSLDDYKNNIVSIRNSYFGGRNRTASNSSPNSISAFVKSKNSALDVELTNAIEAAFDAINKIGKNGTVPFRNAIKGGNNPDIENAMEACADLEDSLNKIKSLKD
jgi:uncharacterized iron-regulated protein